VLRGTATVVLGRQELPVRVAPPPDVNVDTTTKDAAEAKLRSGKRVVLRVEPREARFVPGWAAAGERAEESG
jgi:hypothetical protein